MLKSTEILGVSITTGTEKKVLEYIIDMVTQGHKQLFISTPNPEIVTYSQAHPEYRSRLNSSDIALPDGVGLLFAARILGKPLRHRITGVDFMEKLCKASQEKPMSMGFLGGKSGVAERSVKRLQEKYPWIDVVFVGEEWAKGKHDAVSYSNKSLYSEAGPVRSFPPTSARSSLAAAANELHADGRPSSSATRKKNNTIDILFVAFGAPKQEEWIYENLPKLPVKAAIGVGGAFDYLSGEVRRAPKFIRLIGLEWLFRLVTQPWRWRRQLSLITFLLLVLKERVFGKTN